MTISVSDFVKRNQGKFIVIPGYRTAECVGVFWKFNQDCNKGEQYSANGAADLFDFPWKTYDKITNGQYQYGDQLVWSGRTGAYPNNGFGHTATYLGTMASGALRCLTQNPGATHIDYLSPQGLRGALRARFMMSGMSGTTLYKRLVSQNVAWVRTAPRPNAPVVRLHPAGIKRGTSINLTGYVKGADPYGTGDNAWGVTVSDGKEAYVWMNAVGNDLTGLPYLGDRSAL